MRLLGTGLKCLEIFVKRRRNMSKKILAELVKKEQLKNDIFKFSIKAPEIVKESKPGNFIEIRVSDQTEPFLRMLRRTRCL